MPVAPATWESEAEGSVEYRSSRDQPGQQNETLMSKKRKKEGLELELSGSGGLCA